MRFRLWVENTVIDELEELQGEPQLLQYLQQRKIHFYAPKLLTKILVISLPTGLYVIDDFQFIMPQEASQWVWDQSHKLHQYLTPQDFNQEFWQSVSPGTILYHGTSEENWEAIKGVGALNPQCKTRGLSNRHVGCAIFLSWNHELTLSYGDVTLNVHVGKMKQDRIMPTVEREPDIEEKESLSSLAHAIGLEDFDPEHSSDTDADTVIIYGSIPLQYLTDDSPPKAQWRL